jgi:NDP-sugar pyrophosphorylase family protein
VAIQCLILAGGLGTRMRPATARLPKALLPVSGAPFVDHQLRWLAGHGVDEVVLCIGHLGAMLRDHVGDGARLGLPVRYVDEGRDLRGTAGALRLALEAGLLAERFLVTYGDSYLPIDFGAVAGAFGRGSAPALMTVFENQGRWDTSNCLVEGGRVHYDKRRRDPALAGRMRHIDYGLSALRREVVAERVAPGARADLADLFHDLSREGLLLAYEVTTRFYEIGSPQGLTDLEEFLLNSRTSRHPTDRP